MSVRKYLSFTVAGLAPHVKLTTGGCWEWQGARDSGGYGVADHNKKVHRLSYIANLGPVGELQVLHSCDNPPCCNPLHLFLGTNADNMADKRRKLRSGKLCHFLDVIMAYSDAGMTSEILGDMLGVSGSAIRLRLKELRDEQG